MSQERDTKNNFEGIRPLRRDVPVEEPKAHFALLALPFSFGICTQKSDGQGVFSVGGRAPAEGEKQS